MMASIDGPDGHQDGKWFMQFMRSATDLFDGPGHQDGQLHIFVDGPGHLDGQLEICVDGTWPPVWSARDLC